MSLLLWKALILHSKWHNKVQKKGTARHKSGIASWISLSQVYFNWVNIYVLHGEFFKFYMSTHYIINVSIFKIFLKYWIYWKYWKILKITLLSPFTLLQSSDSYCYYLLQVQICLLQHHIINGFIESESILPTYWFWNAFVWCYTSFFVHLF